MKVAVSSYELITISGEGEIEYLSSDNIRYMIGSEENSPLKNMMGQSYDNHQFDKYKD